MYLLAVHIAKNDFGEHHMEKDKHLGLRIDSETLEKLRNLAEYEGRSINGEVLYLIRQAVKKHEANNK